MKLGKSHNRSFQLKFSYDIINLSIFIEQLTVCGESIDFRAFGRSNDWISMKISTNYSVILQMFDDEAKNLKHKSLSETQIFFFFHFSIRFRISIHSFQIQFYQKLFFMWLIPNWYA